MLPPFTTAAPRVYVNGTEQGSRDINWPIAADVTPLTMGGELNEGQAGHFLTADPDDLTLYNQALFSNEIAALAKATNRSSRRDIDAVVGFSCGIAT